MKTASRYRLDVSYDGTAYAGWQIQPNGVTVQEKLEEVLSTLCQTSCKVHGSGRTDQGVHARKQVAHIDLPPDCKMPPDSLCRGANALLPPDIRVIKIRRAAPDFHARHSARGKEYRYFIWNAPVVPPWLRYYRAHVPHHLDLDAIGRAGHTLVGRHDFAAFTANPNRVVESTVRTVFDIRIMTRGPDITMCVKGEGFLYKMVRSLAGYLIRVGKGEVAPDDAARVLHSKERTAHVPTAPPQGLFLWNVTY